MDRKGDGILHELAVLQNYILLAEEHELRLLHLCGTPKCWLYSVHHFSICDPIKRQRSNKVSRRVLNFDASSAVVTELDQAAFLRL